MKKTKILWSDDEGAKFILEALEMTIDEDGFLCKGGEQLLDIVDNEPVTLSQLGGISKRGIFKRDLHSLMSIK